MSEVEPVRLGDEEEENMEQQRKSGSESRWFTISMFLIGFIVGGGADRLAGELRFRELETRADSIEDSIGELQITINRDLTAMRRENTQAHDQIKEQVSSVSNRLSLMEGSVGRRRQ